MWRPSSWSEAQALVGLAEESASLDFKKTITSKNDEIAKDIAAMTVNGGVLLYGVDEDPATGLAKELCPIETRGVEERLRNIAGTRISPTPRVSICLLYTSPSPR